VSKSLPDRADAQNTVDVQAQSPIRAIDWEEMAQVGHHQWSRSISVLGDYYFKPDPWQNTSTSYTQASGSGSVGLDYVHLGGRLRGRIRDDGLYEVGLVAVAAAVEIQITVDDLSDGVTLTTESHIWSSGSLGVDAHWWTLDPADVGSSQTPNDCITYTLQARVPESGTAQIAWLAGLERIFTDASKIPRNRP
jgi:hypothetical protein